MLELPKNFEAEQALLGAMLYDNRAYHRISDITRPEHFADPAHGKLFEAIAAQIERGQIANPVTLKAFSEQDDGLKAAGGPRYLARLYAASGVPLDAHVYAELVRDQHLRRRLIEITEHARAVAASASTQQDALGQIGALERELYDLATVDRPVGGFKSSGAALDEALDQAEAAYKGGGQLVGVSTGFRSLDRFLGGLHKSDLIILAGRPSMGKTALATNIAFHAAKAFDTGDKRNGAIVGFFSLEMAASQIMLRGAAEHIQVSAEAIRQGRINSFQWDRLQSAQEGMARLPLFIDDAAGLTIGEIRARARRQKRQHGLGLLVVDYLQLIEGSAKGRGDRVQQVSEISRGLKTLAKELDVPVLALSQLSRQVESRTDKRPQLSDLRESGSIEQDADVVMFVYREEYYLERSDKKNSHEHISSMGKAELIVAKHRNGPTGTVEMTFNGALTKFCDPPSTGPGHA